MWYRAQFQIVGRRRGAGPKCGRFSEAHPFGRCQRLQSLCWCASNAQIEYELLYHSSNDCRALETNRETSEATQYLYFLIFGDCERENVDYFLHRRGQVTAQIFRI